MRQLKASEPDLFSRPMTGGADGYVTWLQQRADSTNRLAQLSGLPLNHCVEVTLQDGVRLRGVLRLKEEMLFQEQILVDGLNLTVDSVEFGSLEIDSCIRMD